MADEPSELPSLIGERDDEPSILVGGGSGGAGTPILKATSGNAASGARAKSSGKKGKRISELQAKFETSMNESRLSHAAASEERASKPVSRDSSRRLTQHWETIRWLRENVVTTKEF